MTRSRSRCFDYDWSASEVYSLHSQEGDPLAMKLLSGTIKPSKGGKTSLVFSSDFSIPILSGPSESHGLRFSPVMITLPVKVRFEQAVYGSFPFWHRGYAVLLGRLHSKWRARARAWWCFRRRRWRQRQRASASAPAPA